MNPVREGVRMTPNGSGGRAAINISKAASAQGLKETLQAEAARRALNPSKLVRTLLAWSVNNRDKFTDLKKARPKPGEHIGTQVPTSVRDQLNAWAAQKGTDRSLLCCFILEKALEAKLLDAALKESNYSS